MQEGGREMEGGGPIGKGWMAGGTGIEEVRQGRRKRDREDEGGREGERTQGWEGEGKRDSAPRMKLRGRECNWSDLKTMLY